MKKHTNANANERLETINKRTGRNMPQAIATGAILIIIILLSLFIYSPVFVYLVVVAMFLGIWELKVDFAISGYRLPLLVLCAACAVIELGTYYSAHHVTTMILTFIICAIVVAFVAALGFDPGFDQARAVEKKLSGSDIVATDQKKPSRLQNSFTSLFALVYLPLLSCFIILPMTQTNSNIRVLIILLLPALSDLGGLVFGAALGKHKLSPRISPKKSYEGLAGSFVFAFVGAFLFLFFGFWNANLTTKLWLSLILGVVVAITSTFGDLSASMLKRDLGIKDMGHLLKGHGGILDRVDSILISAPFIFGLLLLVGV
jgi:phosphatidate cytidylyltransferase